jgi:hypothetical protein
MMLNRTRALLLCAIVGASPAMLNAQAAATFPAPPVLSAMSVNSAQMDVVVKLKIPEGISAPIGSELSVWNDLPPQTDGNLTITTFTTGIAPTASPAVDCLVRIAITPSAPLPDDAANRCLAIVTAQLKSRLKFDSSISKEGRLAKVAQLEAQEADLNRKISALSVLNEVQSNTKELLSEKLKQLRAEAQRLEMDRTAKEARRQALAMEVDRQRAVAVAARGDDAIAKELQNLVKLREQEATLKRSQISTGIVPASEGPAVEAQLAEAKIRLAEREAQLSKAGKGELLDRLSDELAMVSVDVTETELRLQQVRNDLRMYDPRSIDPQGLSRVIASEPALREERSGNNNAISLRQEYQAQLQKIYAERFNLKVADIEVVQNGPLQPISGRGGRRGGAAPTGGGFGGRGGAGVQFQPTQP